MIKTINRLKCILAIGLLAPIVSHAGVTLTNIFSFNGTNGARPTILVQAGNNKFYGVTQIGGPNYFYISLLDSDRDFGGIFSITSDGAFSNLFFFENTNGSYGDYLTPGMDGNFYGTTSDTLFRLNPDGTMANPDLAPLPASPDFGLVQDHDGTLYGTTTSGGPSGNGTIYKVDTNGVPSTLVAFSGGTNFGAPFSLLLGLDDNFYGLDDVSSPGSNPGDPLGSIFRVDRNGNLTNIFVFTAPDFFPSWLVQGSDGDLYGLTEEGGTNSDGSVFRITTNGVLVWSFSFNGTNGNMPVWLTKANDGNFYGVTTHGGSSFTGFGFGYGTIFRITPNGSFTSLVQFDGTNNYVPAMIVQGTDGNLYGVDKGGGAFGLGAIFKLTLPTSSAQNGLMPITLVNFDDGNYSNPYGWGPSGLVLGSDGMLYGSTGGGPTTNEGGVTTPIGYGTIFKTTLNGSITTLVTFYGTNGAEPVSPPLQAPDGNLYGTTSYGGSGFINDTMFSGYGTIYRMDTNGVLTTLFSFNQTNGAGPGGSTFGPSTGLIVGSDGALYGVTLEGGPNYANANGGDGTVFRITTNGDFTLLACFGGTNGSGPVNIIQASDGNFYGSTVFGGTYDNGTVFRMTPDGHITTLVEQANPNPIMQASDGCLYGTTYSGSVFKLTTNGDFTLLASFGSTNGTQPIGQLTEVGNGVFYGTAAFGGQHFIGGLSTEGNGTLFQVTTNGKLTTLFSFGLNAPQGVPSFPILSYNPNGTLIKASDGNYYGTAAGANGSIYSVRPIQAPVLQPLTQAGQFNLSWNAWLGYSYAVMYETNLTGSNWNLLSTVMPQTNGTTTFSDPIGPDTQRFYEVILQLP
jgi:uncharacterized repeat protein (TIGR03803 family)